jgi:Integrase core domain
LRDGSSSLPTSTSRSRSLTCSFAFSKHRLGTLGPSWVRNSGCGGLLEPLRKPLEFVREQQERQHDAERREAQHAREALTIEVDRRIDADATVAVLDRLVTGRGRRGLSAVQRPRADRQRPARVVPVHRCGTSYIEPGSPWPNPYVERIGGRLRSELLAVEAFTTLLEARVLVRLPDPNQLRPDLD